MDMFSICIRITCPHDNVYPLQSHFSIVKLGFTRVYLCFLFSPKHRLGVLVRTATARQF